MVLVEWSDTLSVGLEEIDADHKKLIGIVNDLHDAATSGESPDVIGQILEDLLSYTAWHFRHEERLMQTYGDPGFGDHKAVHEELIAATEGIYQQHLDGALDPVNQLLPFLKEWLTNHILEVDKKTGAFLLAAGA